MTTEQIETRLQEIADKMLTRIDKAETREALVKEQGELIQALMKSVREEKAEEPLAAVLAVGNVTKASPEDVSQMERSNFAMDPWDGAIIEPGWHHVRVVEHPPGSGMPSLKRKYLLMKYEIAPCDPETLASWNECKAWTMRLPQAERDRRVKASREEHRQNARNNRAAPAIEGFNSQVTKDEQGTVSGKSKGLGLDKLASLNG